MALPTARPELRVQLQLPSRPRPDTTASVPASSALPCLSRSLRRHMAPLAHCTGHLPGLPSSSFPPILHLWWEHGPDPGSYPPTDKSKHLSLAPEAMRPARKPLLLPASSPPLSWTIIRRRPTCPVCAVPPPHALPFLRLHHLKVVKGPSGEDHPPGEDSHGSPQGNAHLLPRGAWHCSCSFQRQP